MGDPAGVGPEICLAAIGNGDLARVAVPIVFGDRDVLDRAAAQVGAKLDAARLTRAEWTERLSNIHGPTVVDLAAIPTDWVTPGVASSATGRASFSYVDAAIDAALAGRVDAVVTAPVCKEALHAAGIRFPGHTEYFAERCGSSRWCMMQYSDQITCSFVTVHVGYKDVPELLSQSRILEVIELTAESLERIRGHQPRLAVCGLNPHAGEHGLFGEREEERLIAPAIDAARQKGIHVEGPLPPDTAFLPAKRQATDGFVCMYHDQGHIPIKALAFETAVNTTLGLPIVRTSVDHGTAFDIAWQGRANPSSLFCAIRLAVKLAKLGSAPTFA
jgi:4-hydroxythreonine-4-phosphate dehydrogenase